MDIVDRIMVVINLVYMLLQMKTELKVQVQVINIQKPQVLMMLGLRAGLVKVLKLVLQIQVLIQDTMNLMDKLVEFIITTQLTGTDTEHMSQVLQLLNVTVKVQLVQHLILNYMLLSQQVQIILILTIGTSLKKMVCQQLILVLTVDGIRI